MSRLLLRSSCAALCLFVPVLCHAQATSYTINTFAGNNTAGFAGDGGVATSAKINVPIQVALDSSHDLYFTDSANERIRKVVGGKMSTIAGTGFAAYAGDGGPASSASLNDPYGILIGPSGNVYIGDLSNHVVRMIDSKGNMSTIAGNNSFGFSGDGGAATSAQLNKPFGLAMDAAGNLYICDSFNHRIRKVTADGNINTIAGDGNYQSPPQGAFNGDGGPATGAALNTPFGISIDGAGNIFFADSGNNRIRKIAKDGTITTVAGTGTAGSAGDGGPATKAQLNRPWDVKVDSAGDLFIADYSNSRIRMVTPDGNIQTIAGGTGPGYTGDGFGAQNAKLDFPTGLAIDTSNGTIYIADSSNNVIRTLTPTGPALSTGGVVSASAFGGLTTIAPGSWIEIYGTNLSVDRRQWGTSDFQGSTAPTSLDGTSVSIGGQAAFVDFISGGQVNAQVPSNVTAGTQTLTVKTAAGTSNSSSVTVAATAAGLLAPSNFNIGGTQYVTALFTDNTTYVLPAGAIAGVTSRPAKAGDTIVLYGVGFGQVNPNIPAGQVVQASNSLVTAPQFSIGGVAATATFAGLVSGSVGLYQFNLLVPSVTAGNKVPLTFTLGGAAGTQTLYIAVQ